MDDGIDRAERRVLRLSVPLGSIVYRFLSGMPRSTGNCHASEYLRSPAGPLCNAARFVPCFQGSTVDFVAVESLAIFCAVAACKRANSEPTPVNVIVNDIRVSLVSYVRNNTRLHASKGFSSAVSRPEEKRNFSSLSRRRYQTRHEITRLSQLVHRLLRFPMPREIAVFRDPSSCFHARTSFELE